MREQMEGAQAKVTHATFGTEEERDVVIEEILAREDAKQAMTKEEVVSLFFSLIKKRYDAGGDDALNYHEIRAFKHAQPLSHVFWCKLLVDAGLKCRRAKPIEEARARCFVRDAVASSLEEFMGVRCLGEN